MNVKHQSLPDTLLSVSMKKKNKTKNLRYTAICVVTRLLSNPAASSSLRTTAFSHSLSPD